ncbi:hypothetical protein ACLBXM_04695 [Xanthobacteraceae bacterium A53D]
MKAYNILPGDWRAGAPQAGGHGWCFGLPPGIRPEQWPLDPWNGLPMMHGFTLLLPEDYRVHGPDIVALSFFATAPDHFDGSPAKGVDGMRAAITAEAPPTDPALRPFWERAQQAHPHLHRMQDILDVDYALVLLTRAEFEGPPCRPPAPVDSPLDLEVDPAEWMEKGAVAAYDHVIPSPPPNLGRDPLLVHRTFTWVPRAEDPNAGKPPREDYGDEPPAGGYQPYFYWEGGVVEIENWREHPWAADHAETHIGGTMRPVQAIPSFSPYYIGFDEEFGGYNFGGGNAQLDFKDMKFDWACG